MATKTSVRPKQTKGSSKKSSAPKSEVGGGRSWGQVIPGVVDDYAVPHLGTAIIGGAGCAVHYYLVDLLANVIITLSTALGLGVLLPWVIWRYATARRKPGEEKGSAYQNFQRLHATITPMFAGAGLIGFQFIGWTTTYGTLFVCAGLLLGLTWNVRRAEVIRGEGGDDHASDGGWAEAFGLLGSSVKVIEDTPVRARFRIGLVNGQGLTEVKAALGKIEAGAGAMRGAARIIPRPRSNEADVILVKKDILKTAPPDMPWDKQRRSFADGMTVVMSEMGVTITVCLAGGKEFGPTNLQVMGMTRSGKSHYFRLAAREISRTNDAVLWVVDVAKGAQTIGPLQNAIDWFAPSKDEATAMLTCIRMDVIRDRGQYLADRGLDEWVPGCGLAALVVWIEEAAQLSLGTLFTRIAETCLSVGVFLVNSMQRASHDNLPTSARAQFGAAVCFGVQSSTDSGFVLSEEVNAVSIADQWKASKQGACYVEAPNLSEEMKGLPGRTFWVEPDLIAAEITANAPGMAKLDATTVKAAGTAYAERELRSTLIAGELPIDPQKSRIKRQSMGSAPALLPAPRNSAPNPYMDPTDDPEEYEGMDDPGETEQHDDAMNEEDESMAPPPALGAAYEGADDDMKDIDPRAPLAEAGQEIVFAPPIATGTRLKGQERHEAWVETLAEVAEEGERRKDGSIIITMEALLAAWLEVPGIDLRTRPWIYTRIDALREAGMIERLEPEDGEPGRGRYVLRAGVNWANPSLPVIDTDDADQQVPEDVSADVASPVSL